MFEINVWTDSHPRWQELIAYAEEFKLIGGVFDEYGDVPSRHLLVALHKDQIVGMLMFLTQPIGPEMDCPPLCDRDGTPLLEAKIRAFHVQPDYRRQGIGTALQKEVLRLAAELGCYQVRSRSSFRRKANYAIKLKLGFVAHPAIRNIRSGPEEGVYWIKRVGTDV